MFESFRDTATPSNTPTPENTPIPPTATPTPEPPTATPAPPTETPTVTATPTIDGPFNYIVQDGESVFSIAEKFGIDINYLLQVNELAFDDVIVPGQELFIPDPNEEPPTATPLPEGLPPGYQIEYTVQSGDFLSLIAENFNTTVDAILEANEDLEDANGIFPGQVLIIPVNLLP
jgi:LysM repeat protein